MEGGGSSRETGWRTPHRGTRTEDFGAYLAIPSYGQSGICNSHSETAHMIAQVGGTAPSRMWRPRPGGPLLASAAD